MVSLSACARAADAASSVPVAPRDVTVSASEAPRSPASEDRQTTATLQVAARSGEGSGITGIAGVDYRPGYRLLIPGQYADVFAARKVVQGKAFALHFRHTQMTSARLGLIVPKKFARTAVLRNAIKRQLRELFRLRRSELPSIDLVVRLKTPIKPIKPVDPASPDRPGKLSPGPVAKEKTSRSCWRAEVSRLIDLVLTKQSS